MAIHGRIKSGLSAPSDCCGAVTLFRLARQQRCGARTHIAYLCSMACMVNVDLNLSGMIRYAESNTFTQPALVTGSCPCHSTLHVKSPVFCEVSFPSTWLWQRISSYINNFNHQLNHRLIELYTFRDFRPYRYTKYLRENRGSRIASCIAVTVAGGSGHLARVAKFF